MKEHASNPEAPLPDLPPVVLSGFASLQLGLRVDDAYFQHLRQRLARFRQKPS